MDPSKPKARATCLFVRSFVMYLPGSILYACTCRRSTGNNNSTTMISTTRIEETSCYFFFVCLFVCCLPHKVVLFRAQGSRSTNDSKKLAQVEVQVYSRPARRAPACSCSLCLIGIRGSVVIFLLRRRFSLSSIFVTFSFVWLLCFVLLRDVAIARDAMKET